jgi:hypothetical protein
MRTRGRIVDAARLSVELISASYAFAAVALGLRRGVS